MASDRKESIVENLAVAAIMAFLALIMAVASLIVESAETARERSALEALAGAKLSAAPLAFDDPSFKRVFTTQAQGTKLYATALRLRSRTGVALAAALFSRDGKLTAIRPIYAEGEGLRFDDHSWFSSFLGKDLSADGSASRGQVPADALSGATESYIETSRALGRLSNAIRAIAKENG